VQAFEDRQPLQDTHEEPAAGDVCGAAQPIGATARAAAHWRSRAGRCLPDPDADHHRL